MESLGKMSVARVRNWWASWGLPVALVLCVADLALIVGMAVRGGLGNIGLALATDAILSAIIGLFLGWTALALRRENGALQEAQRALQESLEEQKQALIRERELGKELDHRVRNNVAGLLGLVSLYERSGKGGVEVAKALRGKLRAMHEVHNIIARTHGRSVGLDALVKRLAAELTPSDMSATVSISGPGLDVPSPQAGALAVILHELFTNSQKHGALGAPNGRVDIGWTIGPGGGGNGGAGGAGGVATVKLDLVWTERVAAGAEVQGAELNGSSDGHEGVGLSLIKGFAESDLRGSFERTMAPGSFQCRLRATIDARGTEPVKE